MAIFTAIASGLHAHARDQAMTDAAIAISNDGKDPSAFLADQNALRNSGSNEKKVRLSEKLPEQAGISRRKERDEGHLNVLGARDCYDYCSSGCSYCECYPEEC